MAGGEGRRLRPITDKIPKPLVSLGDCSVLEMLLRQLSFYGFDDVLLCLGHMADAVRSVVGDGSRFGLSVRSHVEPMPRGTLGALTDISHWLAPNFLVMNGDLCTDLDYSQLLLQHRSGDAAATVATVQREERLELGILELDPNKDRLIAFEEKPVRKLWAAMGVNALDREVLRYIPNEGPFGFDLLMDAMLASGHPIGTFLHDGFWLDIGRLDDYELILDLFPSLRPNLFPWESRQPNSG
jgi:NDP-sugar pyrophosphorylase family protein